MDRMTRLEKIALGSAAIGSVFNVFLFAIGSTLGDAAPGSWLFWLRVAAGVLQAAAFDLVAIATVLGQRAGRRSKWGPITAVAGAGVGALIALDVAGVWRQPWLHAAYSLIVLTFMLHLAAPRITARVKQLRRLARRLIKLLRSERQALATSRQEMAALEQMLAACRQGELELRRELASRPPAEQIEVIYVARHRLTWQELEQLFLTLRQVDRLSLTTLRRKVAELAGPVAE